MAGKEKLVNARSTYLRVSRKQFEKLDSPNFAFSQNTSTCGRAMMRKILRRVLVFRLKVLGIGTKAGLSVVLNFVPMQVRHTDNL